MFTFGTLHHLSYITISYDVTLNSPGPADSRCWTPGMIDIDRHHKEATGRFCWIIYCQSCHIQLPHSLSTHGNPSTNTPTPPPPPPPKEQQHTKTGPGCDLWNNSLTLSDNRKLITF